MGFKTAQVMKSWHHLIINLHIQLYKYMHTKLVKRLNKLTWKDKPIALNITTNCSKDLLRNLEMTYHHIQEFRMVNKDLKSHLSPSSIKIYLHSSRSKQQVTFKSPASSQVQEMVTSLLFHAKLSRDQRNNYDQRAFLVTSPTCYENVLLYLCR